MIKVFALVILLGQSVHASQSVTPIVSGTISEGSVIISIVGGAAVATSLASVQGLDWSSGKLSLAHGEPGRQGAHMTCSELLDNTTEVGAIPADDQNEVPPAPPVPNLGDVDLKICECPGDFEWKGGIIGWRCLKFPGAPLEQ